jgi:hypothetical protein
MTNPWDIESNWSLDNSGGANKYSGLAASSFTMPKDIGVDVSKYLKIKGVDPSSLSEQQLYTTEMNLKNSGGLDKVLGTPKSSGSGWWSEAADWAGDKNNQSLIGMGLGAANVGLGLANYLQSSDFMKKQGRLLDQQIANNEYEMGRRQGFSSALADAQNQTQAG